MSKAGVRGGPAVWSVWPLLEEPARGVRVARPSWSPSVVRKPWCCVQLGAIGLGEYPVCVADGRKPVVGEQNSQNSGCIIGVSVSTPRPPPAGGGVVGVESTMPVRRSCLTGHVHLGALLVLLLRLEGRLAQGNMHLHE